MSGCAFLRESGGGAEGCRIFAHCKNVAGHVTGGVVGTSSRVTLAGQNLVTLQTSHFVSFLCSALCSMCDRDRDLSIDLYLQLTVK